MAHSTDQTESSTPLASANAVDQGAATDNTVLTRGMDLEVFIAAKEGKTDVLKGRHDLDQILTPTKNTVLHIYIASASSPNFVEPKEKALRPPNVVDEIIQMCPALLSQKNESGETALHIAARHGRADIVERLIETAKAGPRKDLENGSPSLETWQRLIRETNKEGDAALHFAVRFRHSSVVKKLTKEDSDFTDSANDAGETPLYLAAERRYNALFYEILRTCQHPTYQGPNGRTALHAAVINGDEEMTTEILKKEKQLADKKEKKDLAIAADEQGWTPLHYAALSGCTSIVKQLLQADASSAYIVDKADKKTALHIAASRGHVGVVKQLISHCPDCCELVDQRHRNALHYALEKHQSRIMTFVLKDSWLSNILLNAKDVEGNTPLHLLDVYLVRGSCFIDDARVDKMAFNKENKNALDLIIADDSRNEIYLEQALKKKGAQSGHRILSKSYGGSLKLKEKKGGVDTDETKNVREAHLVVAALIATVTFAAGFTIPGGYQSEKGPEPGFAVLSKNAAFKVFVMTNTLALCISSFSVLMHLYLSMHTKRKRISAAFDLVVCITMVALILMVAAFMSGTYAVLCHSPKLAIAACVAGGCFFLVLLHSLFLEISPTYQWLIQPLQKKSILIAFSLVSVGILNYLLFTTKSQVKPRKMP